MYICVQMCTYVYVLSHGLAFYSVSFSVSTLSLSQYVTKQTKKSADFSRSRLGDLIGKDFHLMSAATNKDETNAYASMDCILLAAPLQTFQLNWHDRKNGIKDLMSLPGMHQNSFMQTSFTMDKVGGWVLRAARRRCSIWLTPALPSLSFCLSRIRPS